MSRVLDFRGRVANADTMILDVATAARSFLLPHWSRWHQQWGPPAPSVASQWTCVRSSMFLVRAFCRCGIDARLQSGQPPREMSGTVDEECGVFNAYGWMGHAWAEANGFVIDITADQFGHAPVIVLPATSPAYRPARDEAYTLKVTKNGMAAIDELWPSWCRHVDREGMLAEGDAALS